MCCNETERAKGIEPSSVAWEATALPLSYARGGPEIAQVPAGWAGGSRQGDGKCRFRRSLPEGRNTSVARAHLTCGGEQSRTLKRCSVYRINRIGFRAEPTAKKICREYLRPAGVARRRRCRPAVTRPFPSTTPAAASRTRNCRNAVENNV